MKEHRERKKMWTDDISQGTHILDTPNLKNLGKNELRMGKAKVYTIGGAMNWFLKNRNDSVICVCATREKECRSFSEAQAFFERCENFPPENWKHPATARASSR
jgi:hypothetical protein